MPSATSTSRSRAPARTVNRGRCSSSRSCDGASSAADQSRSATSASTSASRPGSGSTTVIASVPPTYGSRAERHPSPAPTCAPTCPSIVGTCTTVPSARWKSASVVDVSWNGSIPRGLEVERVDQDQERLLVEHAVRHDLGDPLVGLPGGPLVDDRPGGVGVGVVDDGQQLLEVRLPGQPLLAEEPVRRRQLDPLAALDGLPGVADDVPRSPRGSGRGRRTPRG